MTFFAFNKIGKDLRVIANPSLEFSDYCVHGTYKPLNIYQILFLVSEHCCPRATCGSGGIPIQFVYLVYFVCFVSLVCLVHLVCPVDLVFSVCFVLCQLHESTPTVERDATEESNQLNQIDQMDNKGQELPSCESRKGSPCELRSEKTIVFTQDSEKPRKTPLTKKGNLLYWKVGICSAMSQNKL